MICCAIAWAPTRADEAPGRPTDGQGVEALVRLAEAGDSEAQARLAAMYERGLGVPVDPARARYWRRRAAISGHETDREDYWDGR